ncbi:MAG: helix-turn-helix domain-containing protein [Actinomycetales bacterium]|nr:helix-turn-helix domain-containing protein [Actinomycetales bacterium]
MSTATRTPTPSPAADPWVTQAEARAYLGGITDRTLRRYIAAGELPAYRLGARLLRFRRSDLDALLRPVPTAGGGRIA